MKQHYKTAELTEPVTLITITETADGVGGFTQTEANSGPHLAKIRALRGGERVANETIAAIAEVLFVFHRDIPVTEKSVLLYNGQRYNVTLVNPPALGAFVEVEAHRGEVS